MYIEVILMESKILIQSLDKDLIKVFLGSQESKIYDNMYNKFIIVEIGTNTWTYGLGADIDCYNMISAFLDDLYDEVNCMEYADGIDGVKEFLDKLLDDDVCDLKFMRCYDGKVVQC